MIVKHKNNVQNKAKKKTALYIQDVVVVVIIAAISSWSTLVINIWLLLQTRPKNGLIAGGYKCVVIRRLL